jgi:hypothetical protein
MLIEARKEAEGQVIDLCFVLAKQAIASLYFAMLAPH